MRISCISSERSLSISLELDRDADNEDEKEQAKPRRRSRIAEGRQSPSHATAASSAGGAHLGMRSWAASFNLVGTMAWL
uniref:Uncharacterized protein n=1 Tax=Rhizophora mucronata TaxID=61149 RepID=A0A2P2PB75_RHIMU